MAMIMGAMALAAAAAEPDQRSWRVMVRSPTVTSARHLPSQPHVPWRTWADGPLLTSPGCAGDRVAAGGATGMTLARRAPPSTPGPGACIDPTPPEHASRG